MEKPNPGPFIVGYLKSSIVSASSVGCPTDLENYKSYGGYLVAETVSEVNMPLLLKAPTMLALLKIALADPSAVGRDPWVKLVAELIAGVDGDPPPESPPTTL